MNKLDDFKLGGSSSQISITPGDNVIANLSKLLSHDNVNSYDLLKECKSDTSGIYRIKFDMFTSGTYACYARIYKNGVAYGTERMSTSTTTVTYTEDLSFNANDLIQIYSKNTQSGYSTKISNFEICCSSKFPAITITNN